MKTECPACGIFLEYADQAFGKPARCKSCRTRLRIGPDGLLTVTDRATADPTTPSPAQKGRRTEGASAGAPKRTWAYVLGAAILALALGIGVHARERSRAAIREAEIAAETAKKQRELIASLARQKRTDAILARADERRERKEERKRLEKAERDEEERALYAPLYEWSTQVLLGPTFGPTPPYPGDSAMVLGSARPGPLGLPAEAAGGKVYAGVGGSHGVSKVISSGAYVVLEDRSLWEVSLPDRIYSVLWLPASNIEVKRSNPPYPYTLLNTGDKRSVAAKYMGQK